MLKRLPWIALGVLLVAAEGLQFWRVHKLEQTVDDLAWQQAVNERFNDAAVTPDLFIQFLKTPGGYSIQLHKVEYKPDGLYLSGYLGNPTNIWLSNVSLKFTAQKQPYHYREQFKSDPWILYSNEVTIGEAKSSTIPNLMPGAQHTFEVTIPNVRESKDDVPRIAVSVSGETFYSYEAPQP